MTPSVYLALDFWYPLEQWFPNTAPGTTSAPQAALKCSLPEKFEIHNTLGWKLKFDSRYEEFFNNFIFRCSATFKSLENTALEISWKNALHEKLSKKVKKQLQKVKKYPKNVSNLEVQ